MEISPWRRLLLLCLIYINISKQDIEEKLFKTDTDVYCDKFLLNESSNCGSIIQYYLYSDSNRPKYHLCKKKATMRDAPFIPTVPIKIILHGFDGTYDSTPNTEIRPGVTLILQLSKPINDFKLTEYLLKGYNVISLDYSSYVQYPCYKVASFNVRILGECFAKFIKYILRTKVKARKINRTDLHVIGYNLGAQVGGKAGTVLKKNCRLRRLTALDPILPLFYGMENHVSQECADFVDVLHTKTKMCKNLQQMGHVDFYINNPLFKNSCTIEDPQCYTSLAPYYFSDSISKDKYYYGSDVYLKGSKAVIGEETPSCTRGVYGVYTNKEPPYCHDVWPPDKKIIGVYKINDLRISEELGTTSEIEPSKGDGNNLITKRIKISS